MIKVYKAVVDVFFSLNLNEHSSTISQQSWGRRTVPQVFVNGKHIGGYDEAAAARLSAPGLRIDCGSTPGDIMRAFFQGLFPSPQMDGEAIKGTLLVAEVMASKGYKVHPLPRVPRHDTVQAVQLGSRERLLAFSEAVQRSSPVGSFTKPIAGTTPEYAYEVIFADGTFIDGSTSELSCDGPLRESFAVFCQILPIFSKHKVFHFNRTDTRLEKNGIPLDLQKLRCRVNFQGLKFTPHIETLGYKLDRILQENGPFVALHLRYEMDMLAFSGCTHGCTEVEVEELKHLRYAYPWWREKEIESEERRSQGLCPLTPEEVALVLQALGFEKDTQIYIAAGEIYGGEKRLAALRAAYPWLVS